jgi:hypothetical protein
MEESGGSKDLLVDEFETLFEDYVGNHENWVCLEAVCYFL